MATATRSATPDLSVASLGDDMHDTPAAMQRWPRLAPELERVGAALVPLFDAADRKALRWQRVHTWLVFAAAGGGSLAVVAALVELAQAFPLPWWFEVVCSVVAFLSVAIGLYAAIPKVWLLGRSQAEQCRAAKFRHLVDPDAWAGSDKATGGRGDLEATAARIAALTPDSLHQLVRGELRVQPHPPLDPPTAPPELLDELVGYYVAKRLDPQIAYFHRQARRRQRWETVTKWFPPFCFFISIAFALAHFVWHLLDGSEAHGHDPCSDACSDPVARWLTFAAAAFPVLGAGVRTFRTAHEFGRNTNRFEALHAALTEIRSELSQRSGADAVLSLREAERALETEHTSWMRLMYEAEWFG